MIATTSTDDFSLDTLLNRMVEQGGEAYFGEPVTVLEHCLQTAWFIRQQTHSPSLVAAAVLHDLGHLLHPEREDVADHGIDTRHEELAAAILANHLPASVTEPIRLHVAAKRYLCFADPDYRSALSTASQQSLALQGGPMTAAQAEAFLAVPHAPDAVLLRRADDAAKIQGLEVPALDTYRSLLQSLWS